MSQIIVDLEERILLLEGELSRIDELEIRIRVLESILLSFKETIDYGMQQI
jgi:hypothetical protein